jgi:biopolymer transport protein ExbD
MRRRKHKGSSEIHLGFQIAPMIDVVFVIMLFFMVLAGKVKTENRHNTKLPGTVELVKGISTPDEIAIKIEDDGQISLNDDPMDGPETPGVDLLPELALSLKQLHDTSLAAKAPVLVTIYAAEQAKYERIVECLDALTRASISNVSFQAAAPE